MKDSFQRTRRRLDCIFRERRAIIEQAMIAQSTRPGLDALAGQHFDVAVIGCGINGASAAQSLAAAGYSVLVVDKGDFASGSSGRPRRFPDNQDSPPLLDDDPTIKLADVTRAATEEHAQALRDVLFARTGVAWNRPLSLTEVTRAAQAMAEPLNWDEARVREEIEGFQSEYAHLHTPAKGAASTR